MGRNRTLEADPKGQFARTGQVGDITGGHAFGQPRGGAATGRVDRPQRTDARKEQKQHDHQRHCLQQQYRARAQCAGWIIATGCLLQPDKGRNEHQQREQLIQRQQYRLIKQERRGNNEEPEVDHHDRITGVAHLQQFEHEQQQQQHHRCIQTDQGAFGEPHPGRDRRYAQGLQ